jgi:hypothetical protein
MPSDASSWADVRLPALERELERQRRHLVALDDQIRAAEARTLESGRGAGAGLQEGSPGAH